MKTGERGIDVSLDMDSSFSQRGKGMRRKEDVEKYKRRMGKGGRNGGKRGGRMLFL